MKKRTIMRIWVTGVMILTLSLILVPSAVSQSPQPSLKMVSIEAQSRADVEKLAGMGLDIAAVRKGPVVEGRLGIPMQTYRVEVVVSSIDESKLGREGFSWSEIPGKGPAKKIGEPYEVYHSFDEPINGIKDQLHNIAATYPHIAQLKTIGHSIQKRPMLVMRLTNEKVGKKEGKPQVLFVGTHHAREWVATEMSMRLIKYLTANYGSDARVTELLDNVEVWIMPVGNPDGYQYTFTNERLWRKNLRDNDGDGQITLADGVDLNRNFAAHWGLDDEGSSPNPNSETYRGTAPNSEPEVQALVDFIQDNDFKFILSYHTYQDLILYPWGWQWNTTSLDDPIFVAQAGTDANPAIHDSIAGKGYNPGVGADLYITNGDFTDWAYYDLGIPAQTVELTDGYDFRFPDDEDMVQTVFNDNLEFALSYAESARDPAHPVSPVGLIPEDVYHTPLTLSNGRDQIVEVLARKELDLTLHYNINGGPEQTAGFTEELGETYNDRSGTYYSKFEAVITSQAAGNTVEYWITWDGNTLGSYTYGVASATGNPILVLSAEDYTGANTRPPYPSGSGPHYLQYYTDALDAGGYSYDVWDIDDLGIPSYAEVLSHYEAAIWYTGNDYVPRKDGLGTLEEEVLNIREFMNYEDGKLLATGQDLAWLSSYYGLFSDDFFQYYLGSYLHLEGAGISLSGEPFDIIGQVGDPIFDELSFSLYGGDGANNQDYADSFVPTGHFLPHFDHNIAAWYDRTGIFEPHSGAYYVYSQQANRSYKRLGGTFTLPAGSPTLKFWTSFDIEADWDYAFVEINEVGTDTWTTLPDINGLTQTGTGQSCTSGWVDQIHPFLAHYMDASCNPTGTSGSWNALTATSGGWQQVEVDLSAYAGQTVELYISYASDWGTQNLGVFVDDIELSGYPLEDFEVDYGVWQPSEPPPGSPEANNWARIESFGLPEAPAIRTPDSLYLGFGFEAIDTVENREAVMERVMDYFGQ
ncbi:MAG: M14 family zinc carboxypeptidase [Anaerolineales bacterium]